MIWKKKKATALHIEVVRRDHSKLRLSEWQQDPGLCAMAAKTLMDPNLQLMFDVVMNEHPLKHVLPLGASLDDRAVHQARAEGYEMALATFERLGINLTPAPIPEPVFEPI